MLRGLLLASIALATAGVALAAGGPPVIKEGFTRLPCPSHPSNNLQLEGCAEKAVLQTDAAINARAARIYGRLSGSARSSFVAGERSWLRYRRASCRAQAARYAGGTLGAVVYARCEAARNRTHLTDLKGLG